ncbi:hypothetical protein Ddc_03022 [Ditylenchus destructor]|nr:hypothetical protein Ddc_03022 [Ditylenchus destructor]
MHILTKSIFVVALVAFSKAHPGWNQHVKGSGFPAFSPPQGEADGSEPMSQTEQQNGGDEDNQEQQFVPNTGFFGEGAAGLTSSDESDQPGGDDSPTDQHVTRDNMGQGEEGNGSDEEPLENSLHPDKYPPEIDPGNRSKEQNEETPFTRPRIHDGHTDPFGMEEGHRPPPPSPTSSEELEPLPIVLPPPGSSSSSEESEEFPLWRHRRRFHPRHHRFGSWRRPHHGPWDEDFFMGPPPPPFGMFGMDFMPPPPPMFGMPLMSPQIATPIIIQTAAAPAPPPPPPPPQPQVIVLAGGSGSGALGGMLGLPQAFQAASILPSPMMMGPPPPFFGGPDPGMFDMEVIEMDNDDDDMGGPVDFGMQESAERGRHHGRGLEDAFPPFSGGHEGWRRRGRERRGGRGRRGRGFDRRRRNEGAAATESGQLGSGQAGESAGWGAGEEEKSDSSEKHPGGSGPPPFMPNMPGAGGAPERQQHHQRKR